MDVDRVFHMKEGLGDKSYAQNSSLQRRAIDMVKHITIDTILDLYLTKSPQSLGIADLGCSSGPNTLSVIKDIITAIQGISHKIRRPTPEFRVSLNDLPSNDFNSVFMALPDLYKELGRSMVFISAVPGSFYGRLFPGNSLHFVHASYSLHWLSKVPPGLQDKEGKSINKGNVYISESSNPMVSEAYLSQFQEDFSYFLSSRSEEMVSGGRMVLTLLGRTGQNHIDRGNSFFWDLLSRSLKIMVDQGEIEEEKLNSYDVHFYAPSRDEIEHEVKKEGSFAIDCFEMFEIEREDKRNSNYARTVTMTVRAIQESMISHHFGQGIVNNLFEIYGNLIKEEIVKEAIRPITFTVVLRKSAGITPRKLCSYFQSHSTTVMIEHPPRSVLHKPELSSRMVRWAIELGQFDINYVPKIAIKAQALANFIAEFTGGSKHYLENDKEQEIVKPQTQGWILRYDGASDEKGSGAGILLYTQMG